jgi:N-acyl-D-amino-acid deacylase
MALDLLIKNGTVIDGSGLPRYRADVGVKGGRIVEIGRIRQPAERVIDAEGMIVSPGFIDGHTHMDAQVAWDPLGSCSCWHGVTSVVMGNCGFALAPCKPEDREWFARCLTAVEDIPTEAMMEGIDWTWETFPEYLANVERLPRGSITACISAIRRCACMRWAPSAGSKRRPARMTSARWKRR